MSDAITLVHVTHEGWEQLGGIGTVLQGLITSKPFAARVARNILVGPLPYADHPVRDPAERLGPYAVECLYSGPDHYDPNGFGALLRPIELAFGTPIVYGTRWFERPGAAGTNENTRTHAELLLINVNHPAAAPLAEQKFLLAEKFGIDSHRYERGWDYEEWVRLAGPAYHALCTLCPRERKTWVIGHEFMGVPTALRCSLDEHRFSTAFHAHECSTARRIVENLAGHDVAFYPAMRAAVAAGQSVGDTFGDQSDYSRHALVSQTHRLDSVLAVGHETAEELRFLSPEMKAGPVRTCFNAVPSEKLTAADVQRSRTMMHEWLAATLAYVPDYIFTHVTRPVPSKGIWRDFATMRHLAPMLAAKGKTAAYILLTSGAQTRTQEQVDAMARDYNWPINHHPHGPDLQGPEVQLHLDMLRFADQTRLSTVKIGSDERPAIASILVNQFGWGRQRLGLACPEQMHFDDLRRATDLEFGLSVYEPYGISPLEPLHAGAICTVSTVSGCHGMVTQTLAAMSRTDSRIYVPAEFTTSNLQRTPAEMIEMSHQERMAVEEQVCAALAITLMAKLPKSNADRAANLAEGQLLASAMGWDTVADREFLAGLKA